MADRFQFRKTGSENYDIVDMLDMSRVASVYKAMNFGRMGWRIRDFKHGTEDICGYDCAPTRKAALEIFMAREAK